MKASEDKLILHTDVGGTPKGVAVVVHGLNLAPHCMDPICEAIQGWNIETYRVSLSGHGPHHPVPRDAESPEKARLEASKGVSAKSWCAELAQAYEIAAQRADTFGQPLYLAGFSLGGLLSATLALAPPLQRQPDKMLLFAPAVTIKPFAQLLHGLRAFPRLVLPSGSPKPYRANWGTSIAAYNALLDLHKGFRGASLSNLNLPTLVLLHKRDEFIAHKQLQRLIAKHELDQWSLQFLEKKPTYQPSPYHLIIDRPSLGAAEWEAMTARIRAFLEG